MKDYFKCWECHHIHHLAIKPAFKVGSPTDFKCECCGSSFYTLPTKAEIEHFNIYGAFDNVIQTMVMGDSYRTDSLDVANKLESELIQRDYTYRKQSPIKDHKRYYDFELM